MKILYPHGEATKEEIEEILRFAIEGRKRVKDQILRIDSTMADVKFGYLDKDGDLARRHHARGGRVPDVLPPRRARRRTRAGGSTDGRRPARRRSAVEPMPEH